jgi:hypothetical protein
MLHTLKPRRRLRPGAHRYRRRPAGHIRALELLVAIDWAVAHLADPGILAQQLDGVPLAAIKDDETGAPLLSAAR